MYGWTTFRFGCCRQKHTKVTGARRTNHSTDQQADGLGGVSDVGILHWYCVVKAKTKQKAAELCHVEQALPPHILCGLHIKPSKLQFLSHFTAQSSPAISDRPSQHPLS